MNDIEMYKKLAQPPKSALRQISGGRLNGKTDINPQWRYEAMTEAFGMCGIGWYFAVDRTWTESCPDGQVMCWVEISLFIKDGDHWSAPIKGLGGNFLVEQERAGLHMNDEGYKMSLTDALGTAMKMLGVAADVYAGKWDGSKYKDAERQIEPGYISPDYRAQATALSEELGLPPDARRALATKLDNDLVKIVAHLNGQKADKAKCEQIAKSLELPVSEVQGLVVAAGYDYRKVREALENMAGANRRTA